MAYLLVDRGNGVVLDVGTLDEMRKGHGMRRSLQEERDRLCAVFRGEGLTIREIGEVMDMSEEGVRSALMRVDCGRWDEE